MSIPKLPRKRMKLAELKPHPSNAKERRITPDAKSGLRSSLMQFGEAQNIVWNKRSGYIVGGHERFEILTSEGETEAEVTIVDLDEQDETLMRAALNNRGIQGTFTDVVGEMLERISDDREKMIRELRLDSLLPKETEDVPVTHIPTGRVADRFLITVAGDMPAQADVLMRLVNALREMPGLEVGIVSNKRG